MKKTMMVLALLGMAGVAGAYEVEGNPDRRMSFGLNYTHEGLNSEYKLGAFKISDFVKVSGNTIGADVKFPIASFFTLQIAGGYIMQGDTTFLSENIDYTGYDIGVGLRFYIP